jgi:hypothetical protein
MARRLRAFLAFLYDFVIGDDWRIAVGVVAGLALTYAVSRTSLPAWWLLPVLLVVLLPASLWLAVRRAGPKGRPPGPPA